MGTTRAVQLHHGRSAGRVVQVASDQVFSAFSKPVVSLDVRSRRGLLLLSRRYGLFCGEYECATLGAEAVRQWTFILPGVELLGGFGFSWI